MAMDSKKAVNIFICYAREDESLLKGLEKQLRALQRQGIVEPWHDRAINPGEEWAREIDKHLNTAQIIILLISPDFMDSDYCYGVEMKRAMERHELGEARVVPVILRPVYWSGAPFGNLQALPTDARPVVSSSWHNQDEAFYSIASGIRSVAEEMARLFSSPLPTPLKKVESSLQVVIDNLPNNPRSLSEKEMHHIRQQLISYAQLVDNWAHYTKEKWRTISDSQLGWRPLRGRWTGWDEIYHDNYPTDPSDPLYPARQMALKRTERRFQFSKEKGSAASAVVSFLRDLDTLERCVELLLGTANQISEAAISQLPFEDPTRANNDSQEIIVELGPPLEASKQSSSQQFADIESAEAPPRRKSLFFSRGRNKKR